MTSWKKCSEDKTITSIITVDKVPIPIFGEEEVKQAAFATKSLQL